jgi:hypothetical protein
MKCEDCKWWDTNYISKSHGLTCCPCKRQPPTLILAQHLSVDEIENIEACSEWALWPETSCVDWCGEFKEKNNENRL